jgi:predicted transcriptional regulator
MSTTSFSIDNDLQYKLEATSNRLKRTKGWIINEALRQYIEQEDRKLKMLEETKEAIADIEASRIISGEEVMQWLESWGSFQEKAAPKYHKQ